MYSENGKRSAAVERLAHKQQVEGNGADEDADDEDKRNLHMGRPHQGPVIARETNG